MAHLSGRYKAQKELEAKLLPQIKKFKDILSTIDDPNVVKAIEMLEKITIMRIKIHKTGCLGS